MGRERGHETLNQKCHSDHEQDHQGCLTMFRFWVPPHVTVDLGGTRMRHLHPTFPLPEELHGHTLIPHITLCVNVYAKSSMLCSFPIPTITNTITINR